MLSGEQVLPARLRTPLFVVSAVSAVVVVVLGVLFANETVGTAADHAIRERLVGVHSPWRQFALVVDYLAEPVGATFMFAVLVVVFVRMGQVRTAVLVVAGPALSVVVTSALKPLVGREINDGFLAYPSGHTATVTGVTLVVMMVVVTRKAVRAPVTWTLAVTTAAALAMAWAQVLLNAHYPTDTVGGFAAALAVVPPTAWLIDRLAARS